MSEYTTLFDLPAGDRPEQLAPPFLTPEGPTVIYGKGGELKGQTRMLAGSRLEAMDRLTEEARERGGNAVLAMRFETSVGELGTEVCAYGTAVVVSPVS